jgi:hypothetical protein
MASPLGSYGAAGPADPARVRRGLLADFVIAAVIALLLWPFPLIRLTLGIPVPIHVVLILVWMLIVAAVYMTAAVALWGRTPVMYLLDLGLMGADRPFGFGRALRWGIGAAVAAVPAALGARRLGDATTGLPARLSGLREVAAAERGEAD